MQDMQNSIFHSSLSLLYTNRKRVKKTGNKALQMCQHNSEWQYIIVKMSEKRGT